MSRISRNAALHALWFALAITIFASLWLVIMTVTGWFRDPDRMEMALATIALCIGITLAAAVAGIRKR